MTEYQVTSPGGETKEALKLRPVCRHWMSSRDRIKNQILPQVIVIMGTVACRAIWVESELKAMVRAPPGYAIVGADVDSEGLCGSQTRSLVHMYAATALGWTKGADGKSAKILGRDNTRCSRGEVIAGGSKTR